MVEPLTPEELDELRALAAVDYVRKNLDITAWRYAKEPTYTAAAEYGEWRRFKFLQDALFDKTLATLDAQQAEIAFLQNRHRHEEYPYDCECFASGQTDAEVYAKRVIDAKDAEVARRNDEITTLYAKLIALRLSGAKVPHA